MIQPQKDWPQRAQITRRGMLGWLASPIVGGILPFGMGTSSPWEDGALLVGDAVFDVTPPLGVELAGYHRPPGQERRARAIRQPAFGRALVLSAGELTACIVSLDLCAVGKDFTDEVRQELWHWNEIPPINVHLCPTHTHSMPTFRAFRQWGAVPAEYRREVAQKILRAVGEALKDRAPATVRVGKSQAVGASFNRTSSQWKTDAEFTPEATAQDRWLDTLLQVVIFERTGRPRPVIWYHFSSHPVCYADDEAGPDWCGTVADRIEQELGVRPAFLQGHAGDVNPGSGNPWRGDINQVTEAVTQALLKAIASAEPINALPGRSAVSWCPLPLDLELYRQWLETYAREPEKCTGGAWVAEHFARAWYTDHAAKPWEASTLLVEIGLLRFGELAFVFHPAELYSFYGLQIRHHSPAPHTLVVGYANDFIGYLPDPAAFAKGEYAAITVPKILDLPPFHPTAAQVFAEQAIRLLNL